MKYQREEVPTSAHTRNRGTFWKLLSKGVTLEASVSFHYATVGGTLLWLPCVVRWGPVSPRRVGPPGSSS